MTTMIDVISKGVLPWLLLLFASCGFVFDDDDDDDESNGHHHGGTQAAVVEVSIEEAFDLVNARANDPTFVVLDVRTPVEFADGHIENAVNLDYLSAEFEALLFGLDPGMTILVHCLSGGRSSGAVERMEALGFEEVLHMKDGLAGWTAAGHPVTAD